MIEVENLTRYYGTRRAINNLSFQIEKGEVVGFQVLMERVKALP